MIFDARLTELIAIGASVTANCQGCVTYHIGRAVQAGVEEDEIAQAVEIGRMVRSGAATKLDRTVQSLLSTAPAMPMLPSEGCARS